MSYQSNFTGDEVVRRLNLVLSLEQDFHNLNTTAFELIDIGVLNKDINPFYTIQADVYNRCLEVWNNNKIPILKAALNNDTVTFVSAMIYDGTRFCGFFHKGGTSLTHYTCNVLDSGGDIYVCAEQPKLISGESIKTINGESILGEGDLKVDIDTSEIEAKLEVMQNAIGTHNKEVRFFGIEPVTVKVGDVEHYCEANQVSTVFVGDEDFEIIPTSNRSIQSLLGYPIPLKWFDWLEGVEVFDGIVFDMNELSTYYHWIQYYQGDFHVQKAQYANCVFWSDKPYTHSPFEERTNYTIFYSSQLPLCYSRIPENTYKPFYLAYGVNSDPNWRNPDYVSSYSIVSGATQTFSYYGATAIGIFDMGVDIITLPKDCRGLMYHAPAITHAGVFDAAKTTNFGAKRGSWQDAFGDCISLTSLYIQNLKTSINVSWSPINNESLDFIIRNAANTSKITISVSPYTWYRITDEIKAAAAEKNITLELITTNYADDNRWVTKQDAISDLSVIREGAALGATAVQKEALDDYLKEEDKTALANRITTEAPVTIEEAAGSGDILKTYTFKQNGNSIGTINLAKELVVTGGDIVEISGVKNLQLTIANQTAPVNIPVNELVDVYTAKQNATQVQVAISNTNEISAAVVAGSISATELASNAVTTAKITDKNVTLDKLADAVQTKINGATQGYEVITAELNASNTNLANTTFKTNPFSSVSYAYSANKKLPVLYLNNTYVKGYIVLAKDSTQDIWHGHAVDVNSNLIINVTIQSGSSSITVDSYYTKPSAGIPKTDLASAVQTSLGKADTALQSYTEQYKGTVTGVKLNGSTKLPSDGVVDLGSVITSHQDISGKQDKLVSGTNIKNINGTSLLGSGNIVISVYDDTEVKGQISDLEATIGDINTILESIING